MPAEVGRLPFVAALLDHLAAADIPERFVGVTGEPNRALPGAELALEPERIFHRGLAGHCDEGKAGAKGDDLQRAGISRGQGAAGRRCWRWRAGRAVTQVARLENFIASQGADLARELNRTDFCAVVRRCRQQLTARDQEVLVLCADLDMSYEEIAGALGIEVGTVKSRLCRARRVLRALLAASEPALTSAGAAAWFDPARDAGQVKRLSA